MTADVCMSCPCSQMHLLSPTLEAKVAAVMYHEQRVDQLQRDIAELEQQKQEQEQLLQEDIKVLHAALGISGDNE